MRRTCFHSLIICAALAAAPIMSSTLAVAQATVRAGLKCLLLCADSASEAQLVEGLSVAAVSTLRAATRVLSGGAAEPVARARATSAAAHVSRAHEDELPGAPDLSDIRGQHHAVRALVIAAAGGHNGLLSGPPGTGKTMLAQRLESILPPLSRSEAIEVTRIHSLAGHVAGGLIRRRPFRAPHHSITAAGLVGGSQRGPLGEAVLAHNGVLFLNNLWASRVLIVPPLTGMPRACFSSEAGARG